MDIIEDKIIEIMKKSSDRGKARVPLKDIAKRLDTSVMSVKRGIKTLMEGEKLNYWHSGSTTYIMLKEDFDKLKEREAACTA